MPFLFVGCATTFQSDLSNMKSEIAQLQVSFNSIESKQADVYSKYETNLVTTDTTNASIQELYKKISQLSQRLQDLEILAKKGNISSDTKAASGPLPSDVYKNAYNDFLIGKYDVAIVGFKSFIKKYSNNELAPQAQYYIGESLYACNKWAEAYEQYKKIEDKYADSEFVSSARLKMALCLELLGKKNDSAAILESILLDYPNSAEAFTAKEKIKIYTNAKSQQK
ncbi:MAG: tol-pal system protein YbgF [Endomicrobiaceae bacterium]|nr:tol-pal system protein YbgF [Endomicrobiaceae bacterium]